MPSKQGCVVCEDEHAHEHTPTHHAVAPHGLKGECGCSIANTSSALFRSREEGEASWEVSASFAHGSSSRGRLRARLRLVTARPTPPHPLIVAREIPNYAPRASPRTRLSPFKAQGWPEFLPGVGGQPWPSYPSRPAEAGPTTPETALLSTSAPDSGCFPQTPGTPRPPAGLGPGSYFSLNTKGLSFIMQFTHIFSPSL